MESANSGYVAAKAGNPLSRLLDRISGYDFFVSYAHADAPDYAEALTVRLAALGFRSFLDKQVYVAGDDLTVATVRRIEASSKLVLIASPRALGSHWVTQEVETAIRLDRPVIAIDLRGDLSRRTEPGSLGALLQDRIHIREPDGLDARTPSDSTVEALARSFQSTRKDKFRLRIALAGMVIFAVLSGAAIWQKQLADARYLAHKALCDNVVARVAEGRQKIEDLKIGKFGELIAEVTSTLAQLPDPATDLRCEPET